MNELFATLTLIAGFSITGLFVRLDTPPVPGPISFVLEDAVHGIPLVVNPVVRIEVPAHNVFAPD